MSYNGCTVDALANEMAELIRADLRREPARFGGCRSLADLGEVCDVNEYVADACDGCDLDWHPSEDFFRFANEAMAEAERLVWGPALIAKRIVSDEVWALVARIGGEVWTLDANEADGTLLLIGPDGVVDTLTPRGREISDQILSLGEATGGREV